MVSIKFISNTAEKLVGNINQLFTWAEEIDISVAYCKTDAYNLVSKSFNGKKIRLLLGLDFCLTDVQPLRDILTKGYPCKIYKTPMTNDEKSYHPKIYIAKRKNEGRVVIGSSNLTNGGLYSNVEGNILLSGDTSEQGISEVLDFFENKWNSPLAKVINVDLINEYSTLKKKYEEHTKPVYSDPSFVSDKEKISSTGNSVIVCMTKAHDQGDIYNKLVGVPIGAKKIAFENIKKGTRLFIYYKGIGISKVVEALDKPYIDNTPVNEWIDGLPETYPVRIKTRL